MLRGVNVNTESKFHDDDFVYIDKEWADTEFSKFTCECDDVILCHKGTLGKIGIIPESSKFSKYIMGNSMMKVRTNNEKLTALFLYYWLISSAGQNHIFNRVSQVGVPQIQRPLTTLREAKLQHPPLPEQKAIAAVLGSLDDKIELLREQNETLEALAQTLFKRWFIDFNFPDENGNAYKDSGGKMSPSELGEIPEGWRVGKLSEAVTVRYGKDHKKLEDGNFPCYGSGGIMRHVETALCSQKESVLIPRKGTLSNLMYVRQPFWSVDTMFFTEFGIPNFVKYFFLTMKKINLEEMNVGSAVPSMTTAVLNEMRLLYPPSMILKMFEKLSEGFYNKKIHNSQQIQTLTQLRDTLLPKLMKGEIRIK